jgi:hypothetical protein
VSRLQHARTTVFGPYGKSARAGARAGAVRLSVGTDLDAGSGARMGSGAGSGLHAKLCESGYGYGRTRVSMSPTDQVGGRTGGRTSLMGSGCWEKICI